MSNDKGFMATDTITCSIVIRCYNEEKHIAKLLHGILQQTVKNVEIIIVDSGSTDSTLDRVSKFPVKIVSISPEEFSFGRSLNLGCELATGDYIVVASAHVYPLYQDWLAELLVPFKDQSVSLVYGKQVGGTETKFSEHQIFAKWFPDEPNFNQKHPFCNNANTAIKRQLWQQYRYDEHLTGLEDISWAHRIIQAGYKIAYQPKAVVVHIHNEKPLQTLNRYRREAIALKHLFPNEKFRIWNFCRLLFTNVLKDYLQALHANALLSNVLDILRFRLMQFWGTYRGYWEYGQISEQLKKKLYYPNHNTHRQKFTIDKDQRNNLLIDYSSGDRRYDENN
jgi:rhamnosyltransferase